MRYTDKKIGGVASLIQVLRQQAKAGECVWFRGQGKKSWPLTPRLARKAAHARAETLFFKRFVQNATSHLHDRPQSEWEWLFLMQHYRVPTRLLDWTESPLVALYFAVVDSPKQDGAVWCLLPTELNKLANVSFPLQVEIPSFGHDQVLENYKPSVISSEKTTKLNPIAAIALRNSPRISISASAQGWLGQQTHAQYV
ncbi:MAG: FRG domain-containing protein [Verrucomicrobiia bacterium]